MIRPNFAQWGQSAEAIGRLSIEAQHERSRERYQALWVIGTGQSHATEWAEQIGRNGRTVMGWVHNYNRLGPASVPYQHSGGRTPFLTQSSKPIWSKRSRPASRLTTTSTAMAGR